MNIAPKVLKQEESIIEYSQRYRALATFKKNSPNEYNKAVSLGIQYSCSKGKTNKVIDRIISKIIENAGKFNAINDWATSSPKLFIDAVKFDVLSECTRHMNNPIERFSKARLMQTTGNYLSFNDWSIAEGAAFYYATELGFINDVIDILPASNLYVSTDLIMNSLDGITSLPNWKKRHPHHFKDAEKLDMLDDVKKVIKENRLRRDIIKSTEGVLSFYDWVIEHRDAFDKASELNLLKLCNHLILCNQKEQEQEQEQESKNLPVEESKRMVIQQAYNDVTQGENKAPDKKRFNYFNSNKRPKSYSKKELLEIACSYPNMDAWEMDDYVTYYKAKNRKLLQECEQAQRDHISNTLANC